MTSANRWKVTRFTCPVDGCSIAYEHADHRRRRYRHGELPRCSAHDVAMAVKSEQPLYTADEAIRAVERALR